MKTRHAFTLIEIMFVVAIIGLLAVIAIPNLRTAIETARTRACAMNQKNIDAAKLRWALDHQKALDETPSDTDLFGQTAYLEHKPDCPAGGAYTLNAVAQKCVCSVTKHAASDRPQNN